MHLYPLLLFAIIVLSLLFLVMTGTGLYSAVVAARRGTERRARRCHILPRGCMRRTRRELFPLGKAPRARRCCCGRTQTAKLTKPVFIYMKARCGRNMGRQMLRWTRRTPNASWMQNPCPASRFDRVCW